MNRSLRLRYIIEVVESATFKQLGSQLRDRALAPESMLAYAMFANY